MIDKDIGNGECESSCLRKFSNVWQKEEEEELEFKASSKKWFLAPPLKKQMVLAKYDFITVISLME